MTVKSAGTWAGLFVTLDATGALSAGTPSGVLYVDGTANGATVTITGSNPYKWAVTLPSLTAGQRVDMYITATIDSISTAGIVASEQADTALTSEVKTETAAILADTGTDGVVLANNAITAAKIAVDAIGADEIAAGAVTKIQNGLATPTNITAGTITTVTNLTNLPAMPADWITAAGVKADAVTKIATGVWASATRTLSSFGTLVADIWASATRTLSAFGFTVATNSDANVTAIKAKTDNLPASPAASGEYTSALSAIQADLDNPNQYKADVSGLATTTHLQEVEDKVDAIPASITAEDVMTAIVEGAVTLRDSLKLANAMNAGKVSGGNTAAVTFRDLADTLDRIIMTVDVDGNRTVVAKDLS